MDWRKPPPPFLKEWNGDDVPVSKDTEKHQDMCLEEKRVKSFVDWPFLEGCECTPQKMAEAGFYHCPTDNEPDLVRCYVCLKELDSWDPDDDPKLEHQSHCPNCPFVRLNKREADMTVKEFVKLECQRHVVRVTKAAEAMIEEQRDKENQAKAQLLYLACSPGKKESSDSMDR